MSLLFGYAETASSSSLSSDDNKIRRRRKTREMMSSTERPSSGSSRASSFSSFHNFSLTSSSPSSCLLLLFCLVFLAACPSSTYGRDLVVKTNYGRVRGLRENINGKQVDSFLGIPFAKPPVKDLRFKHPIKADPWDGIFNATERPNTCWQVTDTTYPGL